MTCQKYLVSPKKFPGTRCEPVNLWPRSNQSAISFIAEILLIASQAGSHRQVHTLFWETFAEQAFILPHRYYKWWYVIVKVVLIWKFKTHRLVNLPQNSTAVRLFDSCHKFSSRYSFQLSYREDKCVVQTIVWQSRNNRVVLTVPKSFAGTRCEPVNLWTC